MATPALSPAEEAQKEDEQLLAQNKRDIEEVLKLIEEQTGREEAARLLAEAEERAGRQEQGRVFHDHQGRKIPLHSHTSNTLRLAVALELRMRTLRHCQDLQRSLGNLSRQRVKVLRRVLQRGLF